MESFKKGENLIFGCELVDRGYVAYQKQFQQALTSFDDAKHTLQQKENVCVFSSSPWKLEVKNEVAYVLKLISIDVRLAYPKQNEHGMVGFGAPQHEQLVNQAMEKKRFA